MIKFLTAGIFCVSALGLAACMSGGGAQVGKAAPAFSAKGTDDAVHTLESHTKNGTTVMYFIKEGCPVNHEAAPFVQKLATAYGTKTNLVGVYNGPVKDAKAWAKRYKSTYPIIEDPALKVIRGYGAAYSPWMVVVDKSGKVQKVFEGASPKELEEVNKLVAANAGMPVAKLSFAGSPTGGG